MIKWKSFKKTIKQTKGNRLQIFSYFIFAATVLGLMFYRINSLVPGASQTERSYIQSVSSLRSIVDNPLHAVHKLPTYAVHKLGAQNIVYYRLVSVAFAALAAFTLWLLLRQWFSTRIAFIGTWLFVCSALTLHVARQSLVDASYLLITPMLWTILWSFRTPNRARALLAMFACLAVGLYIPGLVWLPLSIALWQRKRLMSDIKSVAVVYRVLALIAAVLVVAPLIYASVGHPSIALLSIGLPSSLPNIAELEQNVFDVVRALPWGFTVNDASTWVSKVPILDVFSFVMLLLGLYSMRFSYKLGRNRVILISMTVFVVLTIIGGPIPMAGLLPFVYMMILAGVAFMLQQWFVVFPRNTVARTLGVSLIILGVGVVSYYHMYHYFVAWPQTPATISAFSDSNLVQ